MNMNILSDYIIGIDPYSPFGVFISYLLLFLIGSFIGYVGEVLFRRIFSMHKWINPGFLKGPCIPLYGFGLVALHFICDISYKYLLSPTDWAATNPFYGFYDASGSFVLPTGTLPFWAVSLLVFVFVGVTMTLIEFLAGLLFVKGLRIQLWDYSHLKGNIMGIICPLFSFCWLLIGVIYWFAIRPGITLFLFEAIPHIWGITFVIGFLYAILLVDFISSVKLSFEVRGEAKKLNRVVDFEKLKLNLKKKDYRFEKFENFKKQLSESLAPAKEKIGKLAKKVKSKMYINDTIPTKGSALSDETPRMKSERIKQDDKDNKKGE